jgi:hypothetical protein
MTEHDPVIAQILDQALPCKFDAPDWEKVLTESRNSAARQLPGRNRRKLVLLVALVLLAVLVPLSALGMANNWWFLSAPGHFTPMGNVVTVASGRSEGAPWSLVAFMTEKEGLCDSITPYPPGGSQSEAWEAGAGCSGIRADEEGTWRPMVSFGTGSVTTSSGKTTMIVGGPTDSSVAEVEVVESNGKKVTTQTIPAPSELGVRVRYFVTALPPSTDLGASVKEVIARDASGKVLKRIPVAP